MMNQNNEVRQLLLRLKTELELAGYLPSQIPSAAAFQSTLPFCSDHMDCAQWLEHVFLPRMHALLDADLPLPRGAQILPYMEYHWGEAISQHKVGRVMAQIEQALK